MAATPPAQIRAEPSTPPTPLHGSAYHDGLSPRYQFRSSVRRTPDLSQSSETQTPKSKRSDRAPPSPRLPSLQSNLHSPQATPKRKSTHNALVISPASPDEDSAPSPVTAPKRRPHHLSAGTIMAEGMLPTPVKTPRKKQASKSHHSARALFQDAEQPEVVFQSPRKSRKPKRYNGFSLESFSADGEPQEQIQIFTDSRDRVPEIDASKDNPFYESKPTHHKVQGTSKRRKVNANQETKSLDPQVQEAIDHDDGMVYVFRGKKVYRRFDDGGEEEEVIDADAIDFDPEQNSNKPRRLVKTLTRKSIRPKRLFQAPRPQPADDEEADTEVEDPLDDVPTSPQPSPRRSSRAKPSASDESASASKQKKTSPFDTWPRVKAGSQSSSGTARKRTAEEAIAT